MCPFSPIARSYGGLCMQMFVLYSDFYLFFYPILNFILIKVRTIFLFTFTRIQTSDVTNKIKNTISVIKLQMYRITRGYIQILHYNMLLSKKRKLKLAFHECHQPSKPYHPLKRSIMPSEQTSVHRNDLLGSLQVIPFGLTV